MRGTPHSHSLVCVSKLMTDSNGDPILNEEGRQCKMDSEDVSSEDPEKVKKVTDLMAHISTAQLEKRSEGDNSDLPNDDREESRFNEESYDFNPHNTYFDDEIDPRRDQFDPTLNYTRVYDDSHVTNGQIIDSRTQTKYRRLQLANNMHRCCRTCWKYNRNGDKQCRFCFPYIENSLNNNRNVTVLTDRDKRSRIRHKVKPARNNGHMNATYFNPLIPIAHGGNVDIGYIDTVAGAAEYSADYSSKVEAPDETRLSKMFAKKLARYREYGEFVTDRQKLQAVGNAVVSSSQVGAVQACYMLLGLPLVISSTTVLNVNPLPSKIHNIILILIK